MTANFEGYRFESIALQPLPRQKPLELWLGGLGPLALDRVARLGDGWLTASSTPAEATAGRAAIEHRATELGRVVDDEHFGISIPYARRAPSAATVAAVKARRSDGDISEILPIGERELSKLIRAHIDGGLSKFVLRPVTANSEDWHEELEWLAEQVLPLQT